MADERLIKRLIEMEVRDSVTAERIKTILASFDFPKDKYPGYESFKEMKEKEGERCARASEKRTVKLYRFLPHVPYIETLDCRNYTKIGENSFSHKRDRMDECGRISLTSEKRMG